MSQHKTISIIGEVLTDQFPDGNQILGGAPFNVAWHLKGFGLEPLLISAVGKDEIGARILDAMNKWGLSTEGIKINPNKSTGSVIVSISDNTPSYEIKNDVAYDYLELSKIKKAGLIYYGSLAFRSRHNLKQLSQLKQKSTASFFVDINLRSPWYDKLDFFDLLKDVSYLKLNDEELKIITENKDSLTVEKKLSDLVQLYRVKEIFLTLGEKGSKYYESNGASSFFEAKPVKNFVDQVGAGDAFSAVMLIGLVENWDKRITIKRAMSFAESVCAQQGATSFDNEIYEKNKSNWK